MAHHVTGSPFQGILHSLSLPLQSTHVQAPSWADVTDAASRLKSSVAKALQSCSRKVIFNVKQRCWLISPLAELQNILSETTRFPDAVTQLVLDYAASKFTRIEEIRKETRLHRLCRKTIAYEPARSVVMGTALGAFGAATSAGVLTLMGGCETRYLMPVFGVLHVATGLILERRAGNLHGWKESILIALPAYFTIGAVSQFVFYGEGPFFKIANTGIGTVAGLLFFDFSTDRLEARLRLPGNEGFRDFCITMSIGALGAISGIYAPLGRAWIAFENALLFMDLPDRGFSTLSPWKPASAEEISPTPLSDLTTALALTLVNTLAQEATGSLIPAAIVVPAGAIMAGGLVAYQQKFQR